MLLPLAGSAFLCALRALVSAFGFYQEFFFLSGKAFLPVFHNDLTTPTASRSQPMMKAVPPIGVIVPSHRTPVRLSA